MSKTKCTQVAMVVFNQVSGKDASMTDGPVGCALGADGLHLGSFCAALSRCAMLLKHISAGSVDAGPPPEEQGNSIQATVDIWNHIFPTRLNRQTSVKSQQTSPMSRQSKWRRWNQQTSQKLRDASWFRSRKDARKVPSVMKSFQQWDGDKLTDVHIMAAQNMIKEEFPELDGLETPLLSQVDGFTAITSSGVQTHYLKDHWVTSSCVDNKVSLYDSFPSGKLPVNLTHQLAAVYKLQASTLDEGLQLMVNVPMVQQQKGGTDCGVFAIAFAYHAARGNDPSRLTLTK